MEELLNKLIEKGWKPFGFEAKEYKISIFNIRSITLQLYHTKHPTQEWIGYSIRNIVSKESGLWQFVCQNGMVVRKRQGTNRGGGDPEKCFDYKDYQYWLIESALCNEDKLEQFLLNNIEVEGKND